VELAEAFGTWVGWIVPFNSPVILVLDRDQDAEEAVVQLGRIGFDRVEGVLRGLDTWRDEGRPLESFDTLDVQAFANAVRGNSVRQVLDVRAPAEWESGHIDGSIHRYVAYLVESVPTELSPEVEVLVACGTGYRASIAASLLQRAGYRPVALRRGGIPDVLAANASSVDNVVQVRA
jgi:rhodanese-related sulfurtransferase